MDLTIEIYIVRVAAIAKQFGKSPERRDADDIRAYLLLLSQEKRVSWSYKTLPSGRKVTGVPAEYHEPWVWAVFVYS